MAALIINAPHGIPPSEQAFILVWTLNPAPPASDLPNGSQRSHSTAAGTTRFFALDRRVRPLLTSAPIAWPARMSPSRAGLFEPPGPRASGSVGSSLWGRRNVTPIGKLLPFFDIGARLSECLLECVFRREVVPPATSAPEFAKMLEALERNRVPFHDHDGPVVGHVVEIPERKPRRAEVVYAPGFAPRSAVPWCPYGQRTPANSDPLVHCFDDTSLSS